MHKMSDARQKELGLSVMVLLVSAALWWSIGAIDPVRVIGPAVLALVLAPLWIILMALSLLLIDTRVLAVAVIVIISALAVVIGRFEIGSAAAAALLAVLLSAARWSFRQERRNRITYQTIPFFLLGVRYLVIGLLIVTAGLTVSVLEQNIGRLTVVILPDIVQRAFDPIRPLLDDSVVADPAVIISSATNSLNHYLSTVLQANPFLTAVITVLILFAITRLAVPFIVWPLLAVLAGCMALARKVRFVHLRREEKTVETITL